MDKKKFHKKAPPKVVNSKKRVSFSFHPHIHFNKIVLLSFIVCLLIIANILLAGFITHYVKQIAFEEKSRQISKDNFIVTVPHLVSKTPIDIDSRAYILYDPVSRTVVDGKNESLQFAPASTTKMMTALVALDQYRPDQVLYAKGLSAVQGSKMGLFDGEGMTVRSLLYGLMLPSGNDAAFVLAANYPGGQRAFIDAMNKKTEDLGLQNTHFVDPSGYKDENYSTAYDLALLGNAALSNPIIADVVKTQFTTVSNAFGTNIYPLRNLNELLYDQDVIGVKTGFTDEAGGVLVTGYNQGAQRYMVVVLKSPDRFYDTQQILYGIVPNVELVTYGSRR